MSWVTVRKIEKSEKRDDRTIIDRPSFVYEFPKPPELGVGGHFPTAIVQAEPHSRVPASLPDDEAVLGRHPLGKTRSEKAPEPEPA